MKKRVLAFMLCIIMVMSTVPVGAFALVDYGIPRSEEDEIRIGEETVDGKSMVYLENDYIHFSIDKATGTVMYTIPTAYKTDDYNQLGKQITDFTIEYPGKKEKTIKVEGCKVSTMDKGEEKAIIIDYTFSGDHFENVGDADLTYRATYRLIDVGDMSDNKNKNGSTWVVEARGDFNYNGPGMADIAAANGSPILVTDDYRGVIARCNTNYKGFAAMGHAALGNLPPQQARLYYELYSGANNTTKAVPIEYGLSRTNTDIKGDRSDLITEVYTDRYQWANPFIALSEYYNEYFINLTNRVGYTPRVTVADSEVRAITQAFQLDVDRYSAQPFNNPIAVPMADPKKAVPMADPKKVESSQKATRVWGYRNLPKAGDGVSAEEGDVVSTYITANRLAVFRKGDGFTVEDANSEEGLTILKKRFGSPVTVLQGSFTSIDGQTYSCKGGRLTLSPTITATWNASSDVTISKDGKIDHSNVKLELVAPTFKFYKPAEKATSNNLELSFTADGVEASIKNPKLNDAAVTADIPLSTVKLESAMIKSSGDLIFDGKLEIDTVFEGAELEIEKLGYGMNGRTFKVNGVQATGNISTSNLFNLEFADIEGEINTFKGQEKYGFKLELNAFDLFETEAELQLKRIEKNGQLAPNNLYFFASATPGIPLVPPAVIAQLNGGGAGFYGLTDTINGSWRITPPFKARGTVKGTYLHLVQGKADVTIGPSELTLKASDISLVGGGADIVNEFGYSFGLNDLERRYRSKTYTGLNLSGSKFLKILAPSKDLDVIEVNGSIGGNIFGGVDNWKKPENLYLGVNANGKLDGTIRVPSDWKLIGGKKLAGAAIDMILGAQTAFPIRDTTPKNAAKQAFNKLDVYLGVAATTKVLGSGLRAWVIIPDVSRPQKNKNWGIQFKLFRGLPNWDWSGTRLAGQTSYNNPISSASAIGVAGASAQGIQRNKVALGNPTTKDTINDFAIGAEEQGYIFLFFDKDVTEEQIKNKLVVTNDTTSAPVDLTFLDAEGTNAETANAITAVVYNETEQKDERIVILHVGGNDVNNNKFTVDSKDLTFKSKTVKSTPFETLDVKIDTTAQTKTISGKVKHAEADKTYVLRTYFALEKGGDDYLIDETEVTDVDKIQMDIPNKGALAPTGKYFITTFLAVKGDLDNDPATPDTEDLIQIASASSEDTMEYTNTNQPDAPKNVALEPIGDESMKATWSEVEGISSYKVAIYKEDAPGKWVDSGYEYELDASDSNRLPSGMTYDKDKKEYSFDMAITGGGKYYMDLSDEQKKKVEVSKDEILTAGKSYKVAVQAIKIEKQNERTAKYYSGMTFSKDKYLPAYKPLNMKFTLNYKPLEADPETHIYTGYLNNPYERYLEVSADNDKDATFEVKRLDNNDKVPHSFEIPSFDGSLMFEVTGRTTHDGVTDTTTRYILIYNDDIAPIISLDQPVFYADLESGNYTVTGTTEPGATIDFGAVDEKGNPITVKAGDDGRFTISGVLEAAEGETVKFKTLQITSADALGNISAPVMATVKPQVKYALTVELNGGNGGTTSGEYAEKATVNIDAGTRENYTFAGWTSSNGGSFADASSPKTTFTMPANATTITANWKPTATSPVPNGGETQNVTLWLLLFLLSSCTAMVLGVNAKRKKKHI